MDFMKSYYISDNDVIFGDINDCVAFKASNATFFDAFSLFANCVIMNDI